MDYLYQTEEMTVEFDSRDMDYAGDVCSYARFYRGECFVTKAPAGMQLSGAFDAEMSAFCRKWGLDWAAIEPGCTLSIDAPEVL